KHRRPQPRPLDQRRVSTLAILPPFGRGRRLGSSGDHAQVMCSTPLGTGRGMVRPQVQRPRRKDCATGGASALAFGDRGGGDRLPAWVMLDRGLGRAHFTPAASKNKAISAVIYKYRC